MTPRIALRRRPPSRVPEGTAPGPAAAPSGLRATHALRWAYAFVAIAVLATAATFVIGFNVALSILVMAGFAAALAGFYRPVIGLYGVGMLCGLDAMTRVFLMTGGLLRWNTFNYLLLLVSLLHLRLLFGLRSTQLRLLQTFAFLLCVGLLLTRDLDRGTYDVLAFTSVFGLFVYFVRAGTTPEAWWGLALVVGSTGALMGFAFFRQAPLLGYIDPNAWTSGPIAGLFAICLGFSSSRTRRGQTILAILAVVNASWAFLSGSRGALLTAICCLGFVLIAVKGLHRRLVAVGAAVLLALVVSTQFGDLQGVAIHRASKLLDPNLTMEDRTSRRSDLALGGLYLFAQHPLTGVGTGGFVPAWLDLRGGSAMASYDAASGKIAHSGWIKVLAENGIVGGIVFTALVLSFAIQGMRQLRRERRLLGVFTTIALASVFVAQEFQGKSQWFLAAGAMTVLNARAIAEYRWAQRQRALREHRP